MVRKAETLGSLDELDMSKRARTYFKSRPSLSDVVWEGRHAAYIYHEYPETVRSSRKSTLELIRALDEAGFLRHDITLNSFCVNRLYRWVYLGGIDAAAVPYSIDEMKNEGYENFRNPTPAQVEAVKQVLKARLNEREYDILIYRLGFEDGIMHYFGDAGKRFGVSGERIRQIEMKALRKLRNKNELPPILSSSVEKEDEVDFLIKRLEEIQQNPIFEERAKLRQELRKIAKSPFECSVKAKEYLDGGISDFSEIERLNLSVRSYGCLKRIGVNTVADIIRLPKEEWFMIRNLGDKSREEIKQKIQSKGYDFDF